MDMKKIILVLVLSISTLVSTAQTATNFTCNDCSGVSHDLFTELDAGKVIVLDWVMPCGSCIGPSLTAYNIVTSYQLSVPGRVFLYMADDYANTTCSSLDSWATSIGVPQNAWSLRFSNPAIRMLDYGSNGMPKIVVLGGPNHTVFYNANNTINSTALQNAITAALSATGINEQNNLFTSLNASPNPANTVSLLKFTILNPADVKIELFNLSGKKLQDVFSERVTPGERTVEINTSKMAAGVYLVKLSGDGENRFVNIVVSH